MQTLDSFGLLGVMRSVPELDPDAELMAEAREIADRVRAEKAVAKAKASPRRRVVRDATVRRDVASSRLELRAGAGDALELRGYASVFAHDYEVLGGPSRGGWVENVARSAFDKTLAEKPDVHLLINHDGLPIARTKSGTLRLSTDARGLFVEANLDQRDPDVQRLATKMERGDLNEMSFAFRVKNDRWNDDETRRTLTEVSLHKGDVSVVNWGANPATSAALGGTK